MFKGLKNRAARNRHKAAGKSPTRTKWRPTLETLEDRLVPVAAVVGGPVYLADGWLRVVGSNGVNDQAIVSDLNPLAATSNVLVQLNGQPYSFNKQLISKGVKFWGYGGHDLFMTNLSRQVLAWGGTGNDTIHGGPASDTLRGEDGNDVINGWGGHDKIYGHGGNDDLDGGDGNDNLWGYIGHDTINGGIGNDTISGWSENDDLYGGEDNDWIYGYAGDDYITGQGGHDYIEGGDDDDTLYGYTGNDTIDGGSGEDYISGWTGNDRLLGSGWDDEMYGGDGNDSMYGQSGNDTMDGGDDHDQMWGYTGDDLLIGGDGNDSMYGWTGDDLLYGREGNDRLEGHAGLDGLMGGNGSDYVEGGADSDRYLTISNAEEDEIADMSYSDAVIRFGGPKVWTYNEVEMVDDGLARLHHRTGNTVLLKAFDVPYDAGDPTAPRLTFLRDITDFDADGNPSGNVGTAHGNGLITLFDSLFNAGAYHPAGLTGRVAQFTIHEIGHSWDYPSAAEYAVGEDNLPMGVHFQTLSGWRNDLGDGPPGSGTTADGQTYVKSSGNNAWWYLQGTTFVTSYARRSPGEDFADTLAAVVMGDQFYRSGTDTPDAPTDKRAWINSWLNIV